MTDHASQSAELTPTFANGSPHPSFMFAMGELSGQVAALRQELAYQREERDREAVEMKARLTALERWRYITIGIAMAVTTAINLIVIIWSHYHG